MKEEEERRSLLLLTRHGSKRSNTFSESFKTRFLKSSSRTLEDDASSSSSSVSSALTGTSSRVMMMFTMFTFMFVGITFERTKREGEKGMRFQHLGDTLNTTTDDSAENTTSTTKLTFTLYTACSPMDKVLPTLRGKGSDDINDDDMKEYDWFSRVKAKLVLKDDDENIGGNDFSFNRGIPMEQITCGEYRVETGLMKRGTAFGFALYEIPPKDDDDDDVSSLGRLIHYENQRNDAYEFEPEGAVVVKDIGCLTTDPKRVDKRCP